MEYFINWGHMYVVHFGAWMTFAVGVTIYKNGLPELKHLPKMLKTALIVATVMSLFSSHSQHYLSNVIPETKILHEDENK